MGRGKFRQLLCLLTASAATSLIFICLWEIYSWEHGTRFAPATESSPKDVSAEVSGRLMRDSVNHDEEHETPIETTESHKEPPVSPTPKSPLFIMIMSSMARSGSTLLSETISKLENSVLFFEPLWIQQRNRCIRNGTCAERYLREMFTCDFTPEFEQWFKSHSLFPYYFNPEINRCFWKRLHRKTPCMDDLDLHRMCRDSPVRIIKVIRARMRWMEETLRNTSINFKLVHLIRDPRASVRSIKSNGWGERVNLSCSDLDADMETYDLFSKLYPSKVLQVSLESICFHPVEELTRVYQFLFDGGVLPDVIKKFITSHTKETRGRSNMSTSKNSKLEFEAWRWKITGDLLTKIEKNPKCLRSIERINHSVFGSFDRVRNSSIPLILK